MLAVHPFDALFHLQRALDDYADSFWLGSEGHAAYRDQHFPQGRLRRGRRCPASPRPISPFVKNNTLRLLKTATEAPACIAASAARAFDRTVTLPIVSSMPTREGEFNDGILAIYLPRAEADKPAHDPQ